MEGFLLDSHNFIRILQTLLSNSVLAAQQIANLNDSYP